LHGQRGAFDETGRNVNIRQLRFISAVARHGLNVSAAAESLFTSQPGVSKQVRQLEDELNVQIFERNGRQLTRITPAGEAIIELADRALIELDTIKRAAQEFSDPGNGSLSIAASHTQARYVLPPVIRQLAVDYPRVQLALHQGTPLQIARAVEDGSADLAIATESLDHFEDLVMLPCYRWRRGVLVPRGHELADGVRLDLARLARHPLITYVFGFAPGSALERAFGQARLTPQPYITASDADVIKTYVRAGMGVGIVAAMVHDPQRDADLVLLEADHLFDHGTVRVGFRRGSYLRGFAYDFLQHFAPHLTREAVETARRLKSRAAIEALFVDQALPVR
jgi:LysR family cys regulon transcriptional activator